MGEANARLRIELPPGFRAAGVAAGIKRNGRKDMALFVSEPPAVVAGVFTTNQVQAAPVKLCRARLAGGRAAAVVVNSGNANACTGRQGLEDAERMAQWTAERLQVPPSTVFVCSTGTIGRFLPMPKIEAGIEALVRNLSAEGALDAAEAMLTTDTRVKWAQAAIRRGGIRARLVGLAKGAGMIEPRMATMLAFLFTDAAVERAALQGALEKAAEATFNRITVDGDRSTNDTVLLLANGRAGHAPVTDLAGGDGRAFADALERVCHDLALQIVADGEGATKQVTVVVKGARSAVEADAAARAVANSFLVKTSWAGGRANWGRVMDALGYSAARVEEDRVDIDYDGVPAARGGAPTGRPQEELDAVVARPRFTLTIDLHQGGGEAIVYTCDCTEEYVRINK